jgi:hypothetical protein
LQSTVRFWQPRHGIPPLHFLLAAAQARQARFPFPRTLRLGSL